MSVINSIPGSDAHFISLGTAETMTGLYRAERENILNSNYQDQDILPLSETFNRNALDVLLSKTDCAAIRIYYGMDEALKVHAILVPVTEDNVDILPSNIANPELEEEGDIVEIGQRCPDLCPPSSSMNQ